MKTENLLLACLLVASLGFAGGIVSAPESTQAAAPDQAEGTIAGPDQTSSPESSTTFLKDAPRLGQEDAPVVLLVVSDFQCPVCRRAAEPMEDIVANFKGDLVVYFIQNPLKMHKNAMIAAQASVAAHKQGQFWAFHDTLFANQSRLSHGHLEQHARTTNLDMVRFANDRVDLAIKEWISRQAAAVSELGARGTPSFFINGKKTIGWGSQIGIEGQIKSEVEATKALIAQGQSVVEAYKNRVEANSENAEIYLQHFGR
jgi:protein-disulfide isomerase